MDNSQLLLDNMDAVKHGVRRVAKAARLSPIDVDDLVADAVVKLLDGALATFDASKGSIVVFLRTVAWRVAADRVRAMNRGGQFSGYLTGFGNVALDADRDDDGPAVELPTSAPSPEQALAERQWTAQAREAVAGVIHLLTEQERALFALLTSGTFNAATYAEAHGISTSTAHVRANRLRAKLRRLVAVAA